MGWEQQRFAVERARDRIRKFADETNEENQMVTLQGEAAGSDAEMLDEVVEFLKELDGSRVPFPSDERFYHDWRQMLSNIHVMSHVFKLPTPELLMHVKWLDRIQSMNHQPIRSTLIYNGVKVRFGTIEQADVFRTL